MKQKKLLIVAVALFVLAAVLILRQTVWRPEARRAAPPTAEQMIQAIQDDPNMPQRAKDIAIGQIRARMGAEGGGGLAIPPSAPPDAR